MSCDILLVSVIVPAYNASYIIRNCLEALLTQDYPAEYLEIIVVDNNSHDDTPDVVQQYPVTLLHRRDKQSSYAARNLGVHRARGEIVAFTDADCIPEPDWMTELVNAFSCTSIVGVGGSVLDAKPSNDVERFIAEVQPLRNARRLNEVYWVSILTANAAYRRKTLEALGGFDERMYTGGDVDLSWRIQREGLGEIVFAPEAIVLHQHRSTLDGMYRQFHRYGHCSALMTALYRNDAAYPQTSAWQKRQLVRQSRALLTYLASFVCRNTIGRARGHSAYERKKPAYWLVAEGGALAGRLAGMWETRFFRYLPRGFTEQDR